MVKWQTGKVTPKYGAISDKIKDLSTRSYATIYKSQSKAARTSHEFFAGNVTCGGTYKPSVRATCRQEQDNEGGVLKPRCVCVCACVRV